MCFDSNGQASDLPLPYAKSLSPTEIIIMKKLMSLLISAILTAGCLSACGSASAPAAHENDDLTIVATIFPEYDWVKNILGGEAQGVDLTLLIDNGVDLHSYQPTAEDILKISTCDLFIYVGGPSDDWVEDALEMAVNKDMVVLNLLDILGESAKEEEIVEGMQEETHADEDHDREEGPEYDEHVWLSLRNASVLVKAISEALSSIDGDNAAAYTANADAYCTKLAALDQAYADTVAEAQVSTLLFGDRFPFRYLTDDYGLSYYAAFAGCSAETDASFETVTFLAGKVDELSLHSVLTIEGSDHRIAETIVENTSAKDQQILSLDSLQSVTSADIDAGADYLAAMEKNLAVLKAALQ